MIKDSKFKRIVPYPFALIFLLIPPFVFALYPYSFWVGNDYQPLGLADALNLAYRLGDHEFYYARGLADHPGVPFYFMNWLALAVTGFPFATAGSGFFDAVIAHIDRYHLITIWLTATVGAAGVFLYVRIARSLVPTSVIAVGLLLWLASTPASLQTFIMPSIDAFALIINSLFFLVLVRLAYNRNSIVGNAVLAGCVGAFAYLNKLSYIYVPLALTAVMIASIALSRGERIRGLVSLALAIGVFVLAVVVVGYVVLGRQAFGELLTFHQMVFRGSGLYGSGSHEWVSPSAVWAAVARIPGDNSYAIPIALIGGALLGAGALVVCMRKPEQLPSALIGIGAGGAAFLSAVFVLKHYAPHYVAGVSATLPVCVVAAYLLVMPYASKISSLGAIATYLLVLLMSPPTTRALRSMLHDLNATTEKAAADLHDIDAQAGNRTVEFFYRTPFSWYAEGFVITFASIPRLSQAYSATRQAKISGMLGVTDDRRVGAYVIDKKYFRTVDSVKASQNLNLVGKNPVMFKEGDRLIELRTVFLLIRDRQ
jgi:hypothetical protein